VTLSVGNKAHRLNVSRITGKLLNINNLKESLRHKWRIIKTKKGDKVYRWNPNKIGAGGLGFWEKVK
jgi:hypothetical protein